MQDTCSGEKVAIFFDEGHAVRQHALRMCLRGCVRDLYRSQGRQPCARRQRTRPGQSLFSTPPRPLAPNPTHSHPIATPGQESHGRRAQQGGPRRRRPPEALPARAHRLRHRHRRVPPRRVPWWRALLRDGGGNRPFPCAAVLCMSAACSRPPAGVVSFASLRLAAAVCVSLVSQSAPAAAAADAAGDLPVFFCCASAAQLRRWPSTSTTSSAWARRTSSAQAPTRRRSTPKSTF